MEQVHQTNIKQIFQMVISMVVVMIYHARKYKSSLKQIQILQAFQSDDQETDFEQRIVDMKFPSTVGPSLHHKNLEPQVPQINQQKIPSFQYLPNRETLQGILQVMISLKTKQVHTEPQTLAETNIGYQPIVFQVHVNGCVEDSHGLTNGAFGINYLEDSRRFSRMSFASASHSLNTSKNMT